jgi:TolB-like protein
MNKYLYLIFLIFILFSSQATGQTTVAIADFENRSSEFYLDSWEKSVPDLLKSELSGESSILLVERQKLEAVLQEQALSMTGLIDSSTAQKVGDLLGAEYVVSGSIDKNADWIMINATITRVSNGETKVEFVRASNQDYLNQMTSLLADNIIHTLLGIGEYTEKIEIKKYPTIYFLGGTAVLGIGTILANQQYLKKRDEYYQNTSLSDFDAKYDEANKWHQTRNVLTVLTGVALAGTIYCWIKNMNPDVIAAREQNSQVKIIPGLQMDQEGNWSAYVAVRF